MSSGSRRAIRCPLESPRLADRPIKNPAMLSAQRGQCLPQVGSRLPSLRLGMGLLADLLEIVSKLHAKCLGLVHKARQIVEVDAAGKGFLVGDVTAKH